MHLLRSSPQVHRATLLAICCRTFVETSSTCELFPRALAAFPLHKPKRYLETQELCRDYLADSPVSRFTFVRNHSSCAIWVEGVKRPEGGAASAQIRNRERDSLDRAHRLHGGIHDDRHRQKATDTLLTHKWIVEKSFQQRTGLFMLWPRSLGTGQYRACFPRHCPYPAWRCPRSVSCSKRVFSCPKQ